MKAYIKDLPGRVHDYKEDAHCSSFLTDSDGTVWGLFMVADGLSGFSGIIASNLAVRSIRYTIADALQKPRSKEYAEIIKSSIVKAQEQLEQKSNTFTTLSLALASEDDLYVAHLGDGKVRLVYDDNSLIITPDENLGGIPANYLGKAFLSDKPIEERINLFQPYREGKEKPLGLQLETDGLISRLTEKEITEILLKVKEYDEPSTILEMYEQRVILPERRLRELPAGKLKKYLKDVPHFSIPKKLSPDEVVSYVISAYRLRDNADLTDIIDKSLLKYDDTTVIYVDLQEITRGKMAQSQQKILDLQGREAGLEHDLGKIRTEVKGLQKEITELTDSHGALERTLQEVTAERDTYKIDLDFAIGHVKNIPSKMAEQDQTLGQVLNEEVSPKSLVGLAIEFVAKLFSDNSEKDKNKSGKKDKP